MAYRIELNHWVDGSGWSHSETYDHVDELCTAEEYIRSLDPDYRLEAPEDGDIRVEIYDEDDNKLSECWVSDVNCD